LQARLASPVCRYREDNVSDSAEVLVDKPAIQRYGADGGVLRIVCSKSVFAPLPRPDTDCKLTVVHMQHIVMG